MAGVDLTVLIPRNTQHFAAGCRPQFTLVRLDGDQLESDFLDDSRCTIPNLHVNQDSLSRNVPRFEGIQADTHSSLSDLLPLVSRHLETSVCKEGLAGGRHYVEVKE